MMKFLYTFALIITAFLTTAATSSDETPLPTIQDLDFLIGEWQVTFEFFNPRKPGTESHLTETGIVTCTYDMEFNGITMFIVCVGKMKGSNGWERTFKEFTEYNSLKKSYERIAIYSNWPGMARDLVIYDRDKKVLDVRGTLDVENHIMERYQDYYYFNDDYSKYTREAVTNFSDMAVDEYNLVLKSTGEKINPVREERMP